MKCHVCPCDVILLWLKVIRLYKNKIKKKTFYWWQKTKYEGKNFLMIVGAWNFIIIYVLLFISFSSIIFLSYLFIFSSFTLELYKFADVNHVHPPSSFNLIKVMILLFVFWIFYSLNRSLFSLSFSWEIVQWLSETKKKLKKSLVIVFS